VAHLGLTSALKKAVGPNGAVEFSPTAMVAWREREALTKLRAVAYQVTQQQSVLS
jgi:hypothetical protein